MVYVKLKKVDMKKILVPLDFTDISEFGLQLASHVANHISAEITMLNYINPPTEGGFSTMGDITTSAELGENSAFTAALRKKNKEKMEQLASKYAAKSKAQFNPVVAIGRFQDGIDNFIHKNKIDLVIMGTSGESTFSEIFLGNHTEQVMRISNCPVLSVKQPIERFEPADMVLATDLHTGNSKEVKYFIEFSSWFNSKMHLVHIVKDEKKVDEETKNKLETYAKNHGFTNYECHILAGSDKEDAIKKFVKDKKIGMISVTTRAKGGLNNLFFGSLSEDLVKELDIPVLILTVNM
jgi:nucleotide-binding universal stress UspA family protein